MKELSLNILDVAENSVKAEAKLVEIRLRETANTLELSIADDGKGMKPDFLANVTDPFVTTRTTRSVGMGLSLLKLAAEQTDGEMTIESLSRELSPEKHGTTVTAFFHTDHIDFEPLGDVVSTMMTLIQGSPDIDFVFEHTFPQGEASLDTREMRAVLGEDVALNNTEVIAWIGQFLKEQYAESGYYTSN